MTRTVRRLRCGLLPGLRRRSAAPGRRGGARRALQPLPRAQSRQPVRRRLPRSRRARSIERLLAPARRLTRRARDSAMLRPRPARLQNTGDGPWRTRTSESILLEERSFPPRAAVHRAGAHQARRPREPAAAGRARTTSASGRELAAQELLANPFTVRSMTAEAPNYRWFTDGQLNASFNCLDVHLAERGHKTAIIFEGEPGTCGA